MKLSAALLAAGLSAAAAKTKAARRAKRSAGRRSADMSGASIDADSKLGRDLLSGARRLENGNQEVDFTWVVDYSIKFQGCHHVSQWNAEADGENEPRIQTKRLARFRLCPTDSCLYEDAGGCDSGYGDYVIDLNIFLEAYWQNKLEWEEWNCEYYENNVCDCENADNEEYCLYDCYVDNGLDYCYDENPYEDDQGDEEEEFDAEEYMECANWDIPDNNGRQRRKLNDQQEEVEYFIGPYCSDQGGKVYLGVFTDEFCTNFADDEDNGYSHLDFYESAVGKSLPYSQKSLVDTKCLSCKELPENDGNNDNDDGNNGDQQDEDEVIEMCEQLYEQAGKCESSLSVSSNYFYPNENACNYIEGIKIVRKDGTVTKSAASGGKTTAILIGVFAASTVLLGAYVYHLKTKLDRAKIDLSE